MSCLLRYRPKALGLLWILVVILVPIGFAFQSWEKPSQPPAAGELISLTPHPLEPSKILVASRNQIFEGMDNGPWLPLWKIHGTDCEIRRILSFKEIPGTIFVLTQDGAFQGDLRTKRWTEFYRGKSPKKNLILSFDILPEDPDHWFLGTSGGLFESDDGGKTWFSFSQFQREAIGLVRCTGGHLFAATPRHLFISEDLSYFRNIFSLEAWHLEELNTENEEAVNPLNTESSAVSVLDFDDIIRSNDEPPRLWLATRKGVFESRDDGKNWHPLARSGLRSTEIRHLVYSEDRRSLVAGTSKGIYLYEPQQKRWRELFSGLEQSDTLGLVIIRDKEETLLAVTKGGFFRYPLSAENIASLPTRLPSPDQMNLFRELVRAEPTVRELQDALIRYNNLAPGKIKRWHAESRLRSLIPTFSVSRDISNANNIDIDRGSTSDPDRFIIGPEDVDKDLSLDLRWDLGDFIFNSNQTSIDSREKLMVELRNDLLSEITRIYYERRRVQIEIVFCPAFSEREHLEKLIRMDELTAHLDGMTGGSMSERLEKIYRDQPKLEQLWTYQENADPNADLKHGPNAELQT
ncbi:MAG: hypothetical protein NC930_04025 [Candidatus Omnitrophica bacterium]|nr:hypothetical protein [Candidatus Omnitrophota bacterium]